MKMRTYKVARAVGVAGRGITRTSSTTPSATSCPSTTPRSTCQNSLMFRALRRSWRTNANIAKKPSANSATPDTIAESAARLFAICAHKRRGDFRREIRTSTEFATCVTIWSRIRNFVRSWIRIFRERRAWAKRCKPKFRKCSRGLSQWSLRQLSIKKPYKKNKTKWPKKSNKSPRNWRWIQTDCRQ